MDKKPSLRLIYASALLMIGQFNGIEKQLLAAETSLQGSEQDEKARDLIGHIASIRLQSLSASTRLRRFWPSLNARWHTYTLVTCPSGRPLHGRWDMLTSFREIVPRALQS
ncbi:hypothetical protein XI25_20460 [Paenibacillus sp. DMB20]|nr:hypothetical protein XI25_20460 [Paenibacillus sp. DMB20]